MTSRRRLVVVALVLGLAACTAAADGVPDPTSITSEPPPSTVGGVGVLPRPLPTREVEEIASTTTLPIPPPERTVGAIANGNRVIMIGDSILASTARRFSNTMCDALVPLGWRVEVDAEVSRAITFGIDVLDKRIDAGWDAALVALGSNYGGDEDEFFRLMNKIVNEFDGVPVVLVTVTEFEPSRVEVNEIIRGLADTYPNVFVVDWAAISQYPGVLSVDGLHPTDVGRQVFADVIAPHFDVAPTQPGECLPTQFHDDSAGDVEGSNPTTTTRPRSSGSGSTTTTRPGSGTTATTVKPSSTTTTSGGTATTSPTTGTTSPATTSTAPTIPVTVPQPTSPPNTGGPPTTAPPPTAQTEPSAQGA